MDLEVTVSLRETFYKALISTLLLRNTDSKELRALANRDETAGFDFDRAIASTLDSTEFKIRSLPTIVTKTLGQTARFRALAQPYSFIGLGTHCVTAWLLKQLALRNASMPFDWIFSNPALISHALKDDFATFLNPDQYVSLCNRNNGGSFGFGTIRYYRDNAGLSVIFNHHDLTIDAERNYLKRCVGRFRRALHEVKSRLIFVMVCEAENLKEEQFSELSSLLTRHNPNAFLIAIRSSKIMNLGQSRIQHSCELVSGLMLDLSCSTSLGPVTYPDVADQVGLVQALEYALVHITAIKEAA